MRHLNSTGLFNGGGYYTDTSTVNMTSFVRNRFGAVAALQRARRVWGSGARSAC